MDTELIGVGTEIPNAAAIQAHHSMRCFHMAVDVNGLVQVKLPVVAPAEAVQDMVGVFSSEAGKNHLFLVRFSDAVDILEEEQLR